MIIYRCECSVVGFKFHALAYLNIDNQLFSQSHTEKQRNCNAVNFFRLFVIQKEIIIHNLGYSQNIQYILHDIRTVENECKKDNFNYVYELSYHFRFEVRKKFGFIVEDGDSVQYSKIEVYLKPPKKSYQHLSFGFRFNVHFWLHLCKVQSQINKLILIFSLQTSSFADVVFGFGCHNCWFKCQIYPTCKSFSEQ